MSPALAMWLPNILLLGFGIFALARVRRDKAVFSLPVRAAEPPVTTETKASAQSPAAGKGRSLRGRRAPFRAFSSSTATSRGGFFGVFALVVTSIATLYVLIDYLEISDDIARHRTPTALILRYYQAFLSPIILDIVPFAFLVAALVTIASLVRSAETTALLAHGVSLHRTTAPLSRARRRGGSGALRLRRARGSGGGFRVRPDPLPPQGPEAAPQRGRRGLVQGRGRTLPGGGRIRSGLPGRGRASRCFEIDPTSWRLVSRHDAARARLVPGKGFSRKAAGSARSRRATCWLSGAMIPSSSRRPRPPPGSPPAAPTRVK